RERLCRGARLAARRRRRWEGACAPSRAGPPAWGQRCGPVLGRARPRAACGRSHGRWDQPRGRRRDRENRRDSAERCGAGSLGRRDRPFPGDLAEETRLREGARGAGPSCSKGAEELSPLPTEAT
ncbi:hypothetical protein MC885_005104, partial [Smutsia gigantea]